MAQEVVVLVHGLYLHGLAMWPLASRLQRAGFEPVIFSYPSVRLPPAENARALAQRVAALTSTRVHFLAHSLGGIVIRHLFHQFPDQPPGRVVTLGAPHQGSVTASHLQRRGLGFTLGLSTEQGLLGELPPWPADRELGSIAGTLNVGLGRLLSAVSGPADGTVLVAETRLPGMRDHICLPVSHTGMLFAPAVAVQACAFLATGRFQHD